MDAPLVTDLMQLSPPLRDLAELLAAGLNDQEIAGHFDVTRDQAAQMHVELRRLVGLSTRQEAVVWCAAKLSRSVPIVIALSPRELEVLALVSDGLMNKEIAVELDISDQTVKNHVHNIFARLGVSTRTEAAHWHAIHILGLPRPVGLDPERLADRVMLIIAERLRA